MAVPVQYVVDDTDVLAHVVARNPLVDALIEQPRCVLSVAGDWAFVPSAWKAVGGEDPLLGIPTTYYAAVQLRGTARVVADPDELAALLRRQLAALQPDVAVADPGVSHRAKLAQIRGIRLAVDEVVAKFKYGGNVDESHRREVRRRLVERGGAGDARGRRARPAPPQGTRCERLGVPALTAQRAGGMDWAKVKTRVGVDRGLHAREAWEVRPVVGGGPVGQGRVDVVLVRARCPPRTRCRGPTRATPRPGGAARGSRPPPS